MKEKSLSGSWVLKMKGRMEAEEVITLTLDQLPETERVCHVFKWSILYSWSVLMFYCPAEEEVRRGTVREGRKGGRNYTLIFHKCRLRCQLEQILHHEKRWIGHYRCGKSPTARPSSRRQISPLEEVCAPNTTECLPAPRNAFLSQKGGERRRQTAVREIKAEIES